MTLEEFKREYLIEVPMWTRWRGERGYEQYRLSKESFCTWKAQSEKINALIEGAEFVTHKAGLLSNTKHECPGIFIPFPEEPDSFEKLARDMIKETRGIPNHEESGRLVFKFAARAKALLEKEGE